MRRYLVILNALAGTCAKQPDLEERIRKALAPARVTVLRSTSIEEARGEAETARRGRYDAVIAVGGDGTHHGLIDALALGDTPLGLIPLGTANDLAAEFGIPKDLEAACKIIREGNQTKVDLITTHGKSFATAGGMGLCTDVALGVCEARKRSRLFHAFMRLVGGAIYQIYMVMTVLFKRRLGYRYTLELEDGTTRQLDAYMAMVMNQSFLGQNFQAIPSAKNKDGALDLLLVKKVPGWFERIRLLRTLTLSLAGKHIGRPDVEVVRCERVAVSSPTPIAFFADGELIGRTERFLFEIRPRALGLLVPAGRASMRQRRRGNVSGLALASASASTSGRLRLSASRASQLDESLSISGVPDGSSSRTGSWAA